MPELTTSLSDRTAVVTGSAQGIGLEIARLLGSHGARVVLADMNGQKADEASALLRADGIEAVSIACDVTDESAVDGVVDVAHREFDTLDIWVNNAGITRDASLRKMTLEDFRLVIDVHLTGTWLGVRAASAVMRERKVGSIVNISSISGKVGNLGQTNYSAAKAGIVGLTKAAAKELARSNVRVNAVQPGLILTDMTRAMPPEVFERMESSIPLERAGTPTEVAGAVLFLASDLSSYMTGGVIEVAGGRMM